MAKCEVILLILHQLHFFLKYKGKMLNFIFRKSDFNILT